LSVGFDARSAAGDYQAPNRFNGRVLEHRVVAGTAVGMPTNQPVEPVRVGRTSQGESPKQAKPYESE
jgi:hypothetical protein